MDEYPLHNASETSGTENQTPIPPENPSSVQNSGEYHYTGKEIEESQTYSEAPGAAGDSAPPVNAAQGQSGYTRYQGSSDTASHTGAPAQGAYFGAEQQSPSYYSAPKAAPADSSQPQAGAHSQYGRTWPDDNGNNHNHRKKEKKSFNFLTFVAMVLVCAIAGFGGGALAFELMDESQPSVIYQAPEGDTNSSDSTVTSFSTTSNFSEVAAKAGPSVVSIITGTLTGLIPTEGAGSGVILTEDGYIITNHHVIEGAQSIQVILADGTEYAGTLVGSDQQTDIAVVKIDVTGLTPVVVGNSDNLSVGEFVLAIGNPMGNLGGTVTSGIISALSREITIDNQTMTLLQMDAAVSPGNSGGGLFNASGELVGIVNAKSAGENAEGLGFAIPVNTAISVAEELIQYGIVSRPALGIYVSTYTTDEEAMAYNFEKAGTYIVQVNAGGSAEAAGLQVGDRITKFGDVTVTSGSVLRETLDTYSVGDVVDIVVERDGQMLTISVTLMQEVSSTYNEGAPTYPNMPTYP